MYESFRAENYRCFKDITVEPLQRVNLIAGKNNVGKTALLEAIWLHHENHNPTLAYIVNVIRGLGRFKPAEFLWELFRGRNPHTEITLSARMKPARESETGPTNTLTIDLPPHRTGFAFPEASALFKIGDVQPVTQRTEASVQFTFQDGVSGATTTFSAEVTSEGVINSQQTPEPTSRFLAPYPGEAMEFLAVTLSDLIAIREESRVVSILRIIEARLEDLLVLQQQAGFPMVWADLGAGGRLPLPLLGDGMKRLLSISLGLQLSKGGVLIVDEVENGLHYSVMKKVWKVIAEAARELDVQVFASTHSEECIRSAHEAFSEGEKYDFALHRLEYVENAIQSVTYDQESLGFALESGWEVR
jgi:predicted ATPase